MLLGRLHRVLLSSALLLSASRARAASPRVLVFLHLPLTQRALQKVLTPALPGVEVTTVGRIADFDRSLAEGPDAVLTRPLVLEAKGLPPRLQGYRGGLADEPYALVGIDAAPDPRRVATVGALDLLGRVGTNGFVKKLVGRLPKVERVSKVEDLLALLQMQRAEAIVLPERLVGALREMSRLNLAQRRLGPRVALPAVSGLGPAGAEVFASIRRMSRETSSLLGVDEWR